jgi:virulence factor Mce-like protein
MTTAAARERRRRITEVVAGVAVLVVAAVGIALVYTTFRGTFGDALHVSAAITDAGDSLEPGDPVIFRDVIVGEVRSAAQTTSGIAQVGLTVQARYARVIPDNVRSIAVPVNLFGTTAVQLVAPERPSGRPLSGGAVIAADTSPGASGLQTALTDAYRLLTAIHPADLDAALTALANALQGQGDRLGTLVDKADAYLRRLAPSLPTLEATISELATVTDQLAAQTPALLGSLRNLLAPAQVITTQRDAIKALLGVAPQAADDATGLIDRTGDDFVTIVDAQQAVLAAFRDHPDALPRTVSGFKSFADAFSAALTSGPYLRVNVLATGVNTAALGPLLANQPTQVLAGITDPTLYTTAQCPRYEGASGPNCPSGTTPPTTDSPALRAARAALEHASASADGTQEITALRTLVAAAAHVPADSVPDAVDLVLGPLLRGSATVII